MKSLYESCVPRKSVFETSRRDTVLDLTDLLEDSVDPDSFFRENFMTDGMKTLLQKAFERLQGGSDQGLFLLQQSMGGGKTHSLFALGLLAKHPHTRKKYLEGLVPKVSEKPIRVVAFSGREVDAPYGIWGEIADQLGKKGDFKDYYSPLSSPGQSAWIKLLSGEPVLILLDELPPYFENAESRQIGDSNLAKVTQTALSTLFNAVAKKELSNVCIVVTDLKAAYEGGSGRLIKALDDLAKETGRTALPLEPVRMNTDEIYQILRTRIFETLPSDDYIKTVADAYGKAIKDAQEMDLTSANPEAFSAGVRLSYPFHPGLKDLYARFKENPGFQQTRGLIRLMRLITTRMWAKDGNAKSRYLIAAHDLDLNNGGISSEIKSINTHLSSAIAHDIANGGSSIAEDLERERKSTNIQDASKCLLMASLSNVPNALVGLTDSELVSYLAAPDRDLTKLKEDISYLSSRAWYLHTNRERRRYFRNVENLNAKLKAQAESYSRESRVKQIRQVLEKFFTPQLKDCYQDLCILPSVDEIEIKQDKVTLVVFEPCREATLHPDLRKLWEDCQFKNRVMFLTGSADTMANVYNVAAELRAIDTIIGALEGEKVPANDPQMIESKELKDKLLLQFQSAVRETFTTLVYPHKEELRTADFLMTFEGNAYSGEKQIRQTLIERQKFTEDISSKTFQDKCEKRLFSQKEMRWLDVKRRSATNTEWQWHKPDALEALQSEMLSKEYWRMNGDYVEKGPFPPPSTEVRVKEKHRDEDSGEVTLKIDPVRGDHVKMRVIQNANKEIHGEWTPVTEFQAFKTREIGLEFICEDSSGKHKTGETYRWLNKITIKSRLYQDGKKRMMELKAFPEADIRYTLDGTGAKTSGKPYSGPIEITKDCQVVLAVAERAGVSSDEHPRPIDWSAAAEAVTIDPNQAVHWKREHKAEGTSDCFKLLDLFEKYESQPVDPRVEIQLGQRWVTLDFGNQFALTSKQLRGVIQAIRSDVLAGDLILRVSSLNFPKGSQLQGFVSFIRDEVKQGEIDVVQPDRDEVA